jgi:hypothetical protein
MSQFSTAIHFVTRTNFPPFRPSAGFQWPLWVMNGHRFSDGFAPEADVCLAANAMCSCNHDKKFLLTNERLSAVAVAANTGSDVPLTMC